MFTTDESDFEVGGRRPGCLAGPEAEAKRLAAWTVAWENRIRCCAITRAGKQCGNVPTKGKLFCLRHGGGRKPAGGKGSERHPLKKPPTPGALHAREMRRLWRRDPWVAGHTVELDPVGQARLERWAAGESINWSWLSPATRDFAAWGFLNACRGGQHPDEDAGASDGLAERIRQRDRKDGLEPPGRHPDRMAASRRLAKYREVPPLGEKAPGWTSPTRKRSKRVAMSAAQQHARDLALANLETCESRQQAIERQLALDRLRLRAEQEEDSARRERQARAWSGPVDRNGW